MESASATTAQHPVDVLGAEHRVILAMLCAIEANALSLQKGSKFDSSWWLQAVEFIDKFADKCHHGKEEDLLFPVMVAHGIADQGGPIGVMKLEHVQGRELKRSMLVATENENAAQLATAALEFVQLLRQHIEKEDHCLFQMARANLPPEQAQQLMQQFDTFECEQMGEGECCRYVDLARSLCVDIGMPWTTDILFNKDA